VEGRRLVDDGRAAKEKYRGVKKDRELEERPRC
jgi:hypothetical protein